MIAGSFAVVASLALLPVAVLLLLALVDAGAHAFLGLSGALLSVATDWLPRPPGSGGALPRYPSLPLAAARTVAVAMTCATPAAASVLFACRAPTRRSRVLAALCASAATVAATGSTPLLLLAVPGLAASLLLLLAGRRETS